MPAYIKTTVTAIAAACALGAATPSHADSLLLFPYIDTTRSAYTFISIYHNPYNDDGSVVDAAHFNKKIQIGATTNSVNLDGEEYRGCITARYYYELDAPGTLRQWEAAGRFNLPDDFGDAAPRIHTSFPSGKQGYMIVRYVDDSASAVNSGRLYGEATVVDTAAGMIMSYTALDIPAAQPNDFSLFGGYEFATSWLPRPVAGTAWYVLPLGPLLDQLPGLRPDAVSTRITVSTNPAGAGAFGRNGSYQYTGTNNLNIHCFGTFGIDDILPADTMWPGGWFTLDSTRAALIWKIQQSGELGLPTATMNPVAIIR